MFYTIYKTTNLVNGKYYIGKHKTKYLDDGYMGSGKILKHAISKYGFENFHKEILHVCESEKQMNALEKILVVPDIELNYNLCDGGKGGWSFVNKQILTLETRKQNGRIGGLKTGTHPNWLEAGRQNLLKAHAAGKIRHDTFKGKSHSEDTKKRLSEKAVLRTGTKSSQYGTCWVTNGVENKKIKKEELDNWVKIGYNRGRTL